ncbi:uncharacterized protein EI97DRAFT_248375 [Westerdykella ornata]|uniref:Hydrophobin n=1 Tax=Westerdykella ornata TaxID=318751 RepID=A0A6A6JQP1_WESOR|nr:uncharacterized protein EI97DRAFT_248375 [Westerdykella ornata]KAF2278218.1 hypothetical protein EI97DRAFT_248375 [Westerdykella ornata]
MKMLNFFLLFVAFLLSSFVFAFSSCPVELAFCIILMPGAGGAWGAVCFSLGLRVDISFVLSFVSVFYIPREGSFGIGWNGGWGNLCIVGRREGQGKGSRGKVYISLYIPEVTCRYL